MYKHAQISMGFSILFPLLSWFAHSTMFVESNNMDKAIASARLTFSPSIQKSNERTSKQGGTMGGWGGQAQMPISRAYLIDSREIDTLYMYESLQACLYLSMYGNLGVYFELYVLYAIILAANDLQCSNAIFGQSCWNDFWCACECECECECVLQVFNNFSI